MQRPVLQRVPTPPLLRHQSPPPSAPPSASAGQRAGAGGLGSGPSPPGCWAPGLRRSGDLGVHQSRCQRRRRAASPTLPPPVARDPPLLLLPLCPRRHAGGHPATRPSWSTRPRGSGPGPRGTEPAPSPSPFGGARPRGREQGGEGDGVLTPNPSPVPARDLRGPPRPQACLSAQAHATRRGSHWGEPRPRAQHLRTPSPPRARAANPCRRRLRVRGAGRGACALSGDFRS